MTERASQGKRPYSVPAMPDEMMLSYTLMGLSARSTLRSYLFRSVAMGTLAHTGWPGSFVPWHDVEGSQKIASQTPIDVYSGDERAHPKPEVLLSTGGTAMRNGTLSTLRAQQLIIEQCHVTIN